MRTAINFILAALVVMALLAPQSDAGPQTDKGLQYYVAKAGISSSTLVGNDRQVLGIDPSANFGGTAGIGVGYALNSKFVVQPELLVTSKGFKVAGEENQLNVQYYFVEVPVLFKLRSNVIADIKPNIYLGPVLSFKASSAVWADNAEMSLATNATDTSIAMMHEAEDETTSLDYGVALGVDFHSFDNNIIVDFRYTMGMRQLNEQGNLDARHSNMSFTIGYAF